jgi:hypothetical protein
MDILRNALLAQSLGDDDGAVTDPDPRRPLPPSHEQVSLKDSDIVTRPIGHIGSALSRKDEDEDVPDPVGDADDDEVPDPAPPV